MSYITLEVVIRALCEQDLPGALHLSESAGWNQTAQDWTRMLALSNCFGIEADGELVASIAVTCYGTDLAWIGMVLTLPEQRGKGFASQLMTHAMDFALGRQIECIKLDATDLGAPVYRKFGFEDECFVERWRSVKALSNTTMQGLDIDWALDCEAFGADRRALIESFDDVATSASGGYACRRAGRREFHFGPCVSRDPDTARHLAAWGASQGPTLWDLFPGNSRATELAHDLGFSPSRKLRRMSYKGRDIEQRPDLVYALAGFEWG